ncbi:uncharacterized protein C3orf38 homolog isoform X2 [Euwallacea fornicatus]|uniref:uncharacterized protein C3orf38 homolog isoform X2 n=1 Tax=Euwallacea fornicatus TaxID=995702 RepID=UPI00338EC12B
MESTKQGLVDVLSYLDIDSLISLARNVTQGLKKSGNSKAIENIIKYSPDELSILRRKAVTRDILFNYLEGNNIKVRLPITKNELIDTVADFWNLPRIGGGQNNGTAESSSSRVSVESNQQEGNTINLMAIKFTHWFYSMLNDNECGAEHFFSDAKLRLNMFANNSCDTTEVDNNPKELMGALLKTKLQYNLQFNPNDSSDGIQGRIDPHGLVMVLACGTLHVGDTCAGVFEQVFALARDPFSENNWKIKNTELNLRAKNNVLESPKLCDNELTQSLLMLPSE